MSLHRSQGNGGNSYGSGGRRSHQPPAPLQVRDDFYDQGRSRSPSPHLNRSRRSPPQDISRGRHQSSHDHDHDHDLDLDHQFRNKSPTQRRERDNDRDRDRDRDHSHGRQGGAEHLRRTPSPRRPRPSYNRARDGDRDRPPSRDATSSDQDHGYDHDHDNDNDNDYDRPASRGWPSKEIMMEGLAPHLSENDISTELRQHYHIDNLDDVRIIRDRQTKQSRQFGFLRFSTLEDAQSFMDANYPTLYLYGRSANSNSDGHDAKIRISYGRERKENKSDEADWNCSSCHINNYATRARCFRCQAPRSDLGSANALSKVANIGDNDASPDNTPSQFLLFRGLEPSLSEELFAKGVAKLNKPQTSSAQSTQSSTKKSKVASTTGDTNLGAREGSLRRVFLVRDRRSNDSWRYGFAEFANVDDAQAALTRYNSFDRYTIASKRVLVTYIHAGVFVPVLNPSPSTERFLFSPLTNSALKLQYWDDDAYVTELVISKPYPPHIIASNTTTSHQQGLKSAKDLDKAKKRKAQPDPNTPGPKKAPSQLQFWSNRHAELHGLERKKPSGSNSEAGADDAPPSQSFADPDRLCCYLCMRQFKSPAELNKHERLSELHRQNLKDSAHIDRAQHKLEKHGISHLDAQEDVSGKDYRDRARERRKIYGVVNKKGEQVGKGPKPSKGDSDDDRPTTPAPSKGAALLSKMGYTAGQGLGVSGDGMKEALKPDVYVAGVGLGAEGGRVGDALEEAEKNTKGDYKSWIDKGRDNMRERYRNMGQ